jgi:predicted molibdopterin-dependent oxidoreductase YjgC
MSKPTRRDIIRLHIDNRPLQVQRGLTILQAAQEHGIYIPTLCAYKGLAPFGGCRLCVVEVDGMRGFPTACTTPAEDGMVVRTHTVQLQQMRTEIVRLILSEHPASCLICDEQEACREYMQTIRKVGVITGCRYCPNDERCELQDVVRYLGVKEIGYPVYYRGLRVEREDPFYDRDYNLCILCGRCIRVCQDVRMANTLSFKQRGRYTVIGPAFQRTHLEAGCEFCGACVEVCPTGALAEKTRKWQGKAERLVATTCAFCGLGCQVQVEVKNGEVIGTLPGDDPAVNAGQLCVKGRFCVAEMVHNTQRARVPLVRRDSAYVEADWEQALGEVRARLDSCAADDFAMLVSANCTNEDLYLAHRFATEVMGSRHVATSANLFYGEALPGYVRLFERSVPMAELRRAGVVLCVMLDARFGMSVVGVELRQAQRRGASLITLHSREHNLTAVADIWLRPNPGAEADFLLQLAERVRNGSVHAPDEGQRSSDVEGVALLLRRRARPVLVLGPDFVTTPQAARIAAAVAELAEACGAGVLALPVHNNFLGALLVQRLFLDWHGVQAGTPFFDPGKRLKVLYLVGENVVTPHRWADYVIYQNCYLPPAEDPPDIVLPAAAFSEVEGTFVSGEGRLRQVRKVVDPPREALADWAITARLAQAMGRPEFAYRSVRHVQRELCARWAEKEVAVPARTAQRWRWPAAEVAKVAPAAATKPEGNSLLLHPYLSAHTYRGFPLSQFVEGARLIFGEGAVALHPEDAAALGIGDGASVELEGDGFRWIGRAEVRAGQVPRIASVEFSSINFPLGLRAPVRVRVNHG